MAIDAVQGSSTTYEGLKLDPDPDPGDGTGRSSTTYEGLKHYRSPHDLEEGTEF